MEDMNALALVFFGMVACFVAFVGGLFTARARGVDPRSSVVIGGAAACVMAGFFVVIGNGGWAILGIALMWLVAVRWMARADRHRARLIALALGVVTLIVLAPG
ncbi:MAG TPA: hypothetical protein VM266_02225 [Solirubrobacteraceae bacterium]|nr:hypothetical protein [Solirubrobacteraceae bacterium]